MIISNSNIIGNYNSSGTPSYLLDTYSAAAAYSLRQLKTGVAKVVRVRRSSDNREENFTATEITDGTLTGFCGVGDGFVVTWYDQVGSNDAIQSVAGGQAKIVSSGVLETSANGQAAALADGVNDTYVLSTNIGTFTDYSEFIVYDRASSGISSIAFGSSVTTYPFLTYWFTDNTTYWRPSLASGVNLDSSNTSTGSFLISSIHTSNTFYNWKNGTSKGSVAHTLGSSRDLTNLLRRSSNYHSGYFQEVILFSTDQTSNRTDIESDINTYYSIY